MSETFSGPTGLDGLPTNGILTQYFELFKFKFQLDEEKKCQLILMLQQFFFSIPWYNFNHENNFNFTRYPINILPAGFLGVTGPDSNGLLSPTLLTAIILKV